MTVRRPRTPDEELAIEQMRVVRFPVASWDKRFFRDLDSQSDISMNQAPQLWRLFIRYRRQMEFPAKERLLALAKELSAPDFRKQEKARREQARIDEMKLKYA